jgi:hypothetical protein
MRAWVSRCMFSVSVGLVLAGTARAEVSVEQELLSPLGQGFTYVASPAPVDLITVGPAGSRMAVYRNGEPGPKFDEIITTQPTAEGGGGIAVVFSPDGSRFAYVGRKAGEFTLIADGDEVLSGKYDRGNNIISGVGFTPDNTLFYHLRQESGQGSAPWRFVMGDQPSPEVDQVQVMLSPVGHGYILLGKLRETRQPVFIRDGVIGETQASKFVYRADGKLFTLEHDPDTSDAIVRLDGEELFRGDFMVQDIVPAPAGETWALIGTSRSRGMNALVVVNGEVIDGNVSNMVGSERIKFSDDGAHWAAIMQPQTGRQYVVLDGEPHDEYQHIHELSFSPDGSRLAYWGRSPTGAYLVIDGEEQNGVSTTTPPMVWSENSEHVGWAEIPTNPNRYFVLRDGDRYEGTHQLQHTTIGLSPDGSRMAAVEGTTLVVLSDDGVRKFEDLRVPLSPGGPRAEYRAMPNGYIFSPDSKYLVCFGNNMQTGSNGVFFNGELAFDAPGAFVLHAGFSPDSRHLFLVTGVGTERTLYVDGEPVMRYAPQPFDQEASMWHLGDDGVLRFMMIDNEGIKRMIVTPSAGRSVHDLTGS